MSAARKRRGLVLGCGGVAGAAWSIAALDALSKAMRWDPREADVLIGTSAGAVLAALLGAGVSVGRMMASQRGEPEAGCRWSHDTDSGSWYPPLPGLPLTAPRLAWQGLRGRVSALTAISGLLPQGRSDMRGFVRLIDSVVPAGEWVKHPATWMMVVDGQTGQRVALGSSQAPRVPLNQAVCASYGVPFWCPPVQLAGRRYLDGGVASPTSADFLLNAGVDEAVILAPMASTLMDSPRSPLARIERRVRSMMTQTVDAEVRQLKAAGIRVIRLEPGPEDLEAIGYNMLDPRRRQRVFATALRTTPKAVRLALSPR